MVYFAILNQPATKNCNIFELVCLWHHYGLIIVNWRSATKLFGNLTREFLKTYIGFQKLHQKDMEKFWEPEYFGKTLFSLWRFPRFLKMLYSVSDLLSELLALGNGSGNDRVFFSLISRYLTLTWENNNFLLYWELMLYYFNKWFNTLLQEISFPQNYCLHYNLKKQL